MFHHMDFFQYKLNLGSPQLLAYKMYGTQSVVTWPQLCCVPNSTSSKDEYCFVRLMWTICCGLGLSFKGMLTKNVIIPKSAYFSAFK